MKQGKKIQLSTMKSFVRDLLKAYIEVRKQTETYTVSDELKNNPSFDDLKKADALAKTASEALSIRNNPVKEALKWYFEP